MKSSEKFLTSRKTAQLLGVSLSTVQLWVESGVLRAWKTAGGHRRIACSSIEELLLKQRAATKKSADQELFMVVVVEDEPVQLKLYEMKFQEWALPINLITAINGFNGLMEIGRHRPDLVISDLDMPGMDGFQMIRAINKREELTHTQIIVVTGLDENKITEQGELPADVLIFHKPTNFDALKKMVMDKLDLVEP